MCLFLKEFPRSIEIRLHDCSGGEFSVAFDVAYRVSPLVTERLSGKRRSCCGAHSDGLQEAFNVGVYFAVKLVIKFTLGTEMKRYGGPIDNGGSNVNNRPQNDELSQKRKTRASRKRSELPCSVVFAGHGLNLNGFRASALP